MRIPAFIGPSSAWLKSRLFVYLPDHKMAGGFVMVRDVAQTTDLLVFRQEVVRFVSN